MEEIQNAIGETWASPWGKILILGGAGVVAVGAFLAFRAGSPEGDTTPTGDYFPGDYPFSAGGGYGPGSGTLTPDPYANAQKEIDLQRQILDLSFTDSLRRGQSSVDLTKQLADLQLDVLGRTNTENVSLLNRTNLEKERSAGAGSALAYAVDRQNRTATEADRLSDYDFYFGSPAVTTSINGGTGGGIVTPGVNTPVLSARDREGSAQNRSAPLSSVPQVFVKNVGMVPANDPRNPGYNQYMASNQSRAGSSSSSGSGGGMSGFPGDNAGDLWWQNIRTVAADSAPQFTATPARTRADAIYNLGNRGNVDAYNMQMKALGYQVDTEEYLNRRSSQEAGSLQQSTRPKQGFSINTPWGGLTVGGSGGTNISYTGQNSQGRTPSVVRTPTTFPTGGWNLGSILKGGSQNA